MRKPPLTIALCGFAVLAIAMGIGRFAFTPLLPMMRDEGLISIPDGGLLASAHFVGYLMGALCAGRIRRHSSIALYLSLTLIALSTIAMGITGSFAVWLAARWIAGVCSAIVLVTVSTHLVRRLADLKRGRLQNGVFAGVGGGILIAGSLALTFLVTDVESDTAWILFGLVSLTTVALVFARIGTSEFECTGADQPEPTSPAPLNWRIILPYGAMGMGYIIPATYLPVMAQSAVESPILYALGWPVFGTAAALSTLAVARFQQFFSDRHIWFVSQLVMAVGLAVPALYPNLLAVVIAGVCVGGTFMVITMLGMKEAHRLAGPKDPQWLIAALTAAFAIGQIIGPAIAGWTFELTQSFTAPLLLGSVLLIASLAPLLREKKRPEAAAFRT